MGACTSKKKILRPKRITKETNLLLDKWTDKHIQILNEKFNQSQKKGQRGLDREAFLKVFSDLQDLPKEVALSAFLLFDQDKSGQVDFREFCCALSLICLSGTNEKIRFVFDLFDLDRDGYLNRVEIEKLLKTAVVSFRKFSKGPGQKADQDWIAYHLQEILHEGKDRLDFEQFKIWAEENLNVFQLLNTFEIVPGPVKERQKIEDILRVSTKEPGDTYYVVSFRWWEQWQLYVNYGKGAIQHQEYLESLRKSKLKQPNDIHYMINVEEDGKSDLNEYVKNSFIDYQHPKQAFGGDENIEESKILKANRPGSNQIQQISRVQLMKQQADNSNLDSMLLHSSTPNQLQPSPSADRMNSQMSDEQIFGMSSFRQFSTAIGDKPGEIDNTDIEDQMHRDFILLPEPAWKQLFEWYGGGPIFPRKVIAAGDKPTIELYPPLITSVLAGPSGEQANGSAKTLFASVTMKLSEVFLKICESYNQISTKDARLWFKEEGKSIWQLLEQLDDTLEDFLVKEGDLFMVELKFHGEYPRDKLKLKKKKTKKIRRRKEGVTAASSAQPGSAKDSSSGTPNKPGTQIDDLNQINILPKDANSQQPSGSKDGIGADDIEWEEVEVTDEEDPDEWRELVVGDKVDIFYYGEWKVGKVQKTSKDGKLTIRLDNESYKNDQVVEKDSNQIAKYGQYTFEKLFKNPNDQHWNNGLVGLQNMGNTCYMNCVLQAILHAPLFRTFLQRDQFQNLVDKTRKDGCQGKLALEMASISKIGKQKDVRDIRPAEIKKIVNKYMPIFSGNEQHDAQEFLAFFLDKLSEDLHREMHEDDIIVEDVKKEEEIERPKQELSPIKENKEVNPDIVINKDEDGIVNDGGTGGDFTTPQKARPTIEDEPEGEHQIVESQQSQRKQVAFRQSAYSQVFNTGSARKSTIKEMPANRLPALNIAPQIQPKPLDQLSQEFWEKHLKQQNSPVVDLFCGQTVTSVVCQNCKNRTFQFENFTTLSLPLPYTVSIYQLTLKNEQTFYINVVKRCDLKDTPQVFKYGVKVPKISKISDLMTKVEEISGLPFNKMSLVEISQSRVLKTFGAGNELNYFIKYIRSKELYCFEVLKAVNDFERTRKNYKMIVSSIKSHSQKQKTRKFKDIDELQVGTIVDACDYRGSWYAGIVVEESRERSSKKIHFFEFNEKWDEWFTNDDIKQRKRIEPYGAKAEEPSDRIFQIQIQHRKISNKENGQTQLQFIGTPILMSFGSWYSWAELNHEVNIQMQRFYKRSDDRRFSKMSPNQEELDVVDDLHPEDVDEPPSSHMLSKYDTSKFGRRMTEHTENTGLKKIKSENSKMETPRAKNYDSKTGQNGRSKSRTRGAPSDRTSNNQLQKYTSLRGVNEEQVQQQELLDLTRKPYKIVMLDSSTHACLVCSFKNIFLSKEKKQKVVCTGCKIPNDDEKIRWIISCFKKIEICIDWDKPEEAYQDIIPLPDLSCIHLQQKEKAYESGIPISDCFDMFSAPETLDDFQCDNCNEKTKASLTQEIARVPDILIGLDITKNITKATRRNKLISPGTYLYDVYAVSNHIMLKTMGGKLFILNILGHYTSYVNVQSEDSSQTMRQNWFKCDDSVISKIEKDDVISKQAYILFLKRREFLASNIINLAHQ